jgi:cytochrome c peroxidase
MRVVAHILTALATFAPAFLLTPALVTSADAQSASPSQIAAMQRDYRRPPPLRIENQALADLGRDLFFAPQLSASGKTACAGCHFAELGWGVTDARSRNDAGKLTSRKSHPLIGIGHAGDAPVGWDGRNASLEAQAKSSIAAGSMSMRDTPAPVKVEVIEERIRSEPAYVAKF